MDSGRAELIQIGLVSSDVVVDRILMLDIEHDHLVDQSELQGRELALEHLGRVALVVIEDEVVEPDPMPGQTDLAIGVPVETRREQSD
jgi:hypothetical protein